MFVVVVLVFVLGAGAAVALVLFGDDGPDTPDEWDPRVARLVRFVERDRGLRFRHPVHVDFMTADDFREEVTADEEEITEEDREEAEAFEGAFRALGLIEGDVDLLDEVNTLSGEGILAFYDYETQRVRVRGTEVTVGLRVTLVHELTHALQDQHFDLSRLDDEDLTSGEYAAFEAVVEGDAQRIEFAYAERLSEADQAAYEREQESAQEEASEIDDVPVILQAYFGAPYQFGEALIAILETEGGNDAIDEVLEDPPTSEEHLMDPFTFLEGDEPQEVAEPEPREGEEEIDAGDFGAITWYLALAERIDIRQALAAVDGWGGDSYLLYERADRSCLRLVFRGDTGEDVDEMEAALDGWTAAMPAGAATARRHGDTLTLRSCDPGAESELAVKGVSDVAIAIPLVRTFLAAGVVEAGESRSLARCFGAELLARLREDQVQRMDELLYADEFPPELATLAEEAAQACRSPSA